MSVVNSNFALKLAFLSICLALFVISLPLVKAQSILLDVYDTDVNPRHAEEDQEVTISGKVRLVDAPPVYQMVTVEWYVDNALEHRATYSMRKDDVRSLTWNFDTDGLSKGRHDVKINASVDNVTDEDLNYFYIDEDIEVVIDDFDLDPSTVCTDESETVELSVKVNLEKGPDDTLVTAKFYINDGDSWDYIGRDEEHLDEDDEKTLRVDYDYEKNDLDEGSYDVKVVVEADDIKETEYSTLDVEDCSQTGNHNVEVGFISLSPEYPQTTDRLSFSVPITLHSSDSFPTDVYLRAYVDGKLIDSRTFRFYRVETNTYTFNIDVRQYGSGTHNIEVRANIDSITDISTRDFIIGSGMPGTTHCLSIDNIWVDSPLKAGEKLTVHVRVSNCGSLTENNVKASLTAFSKTYFNDILGIPSSKDVEVDFYVQVPDEAMKTTTFNAKVYSPYTSNTESKDFTISTGMPLISIKPEYSVKECESNEITFQVINTGDVSDTFNLITEGDSDWITGIPERVTLEPDEEITVKGYANIPCDTQEGFYKFIVTAKNSDEYSMSSNLHVVKRWSWSILPTGFFTGITSVMFLIPWILLFILIALVYFFYIVSLRERRKPMF
jgi:hypothetical protein